MSSPNGSSAAPIGPSSAGSERGSERLLRGSLSSVFRAVTATVVPDAPTLPADGWRRLLDTVEGALSRRPPDLRRQIRLFLWLVQWLPFVRWLRPFTSLDPERRVRWLSALQDAPLLLVRRGFWGVRTLAYMGYYNLPEVRREIGYRAHPRGWDAERVRRGEDAPETLEPPVDTQL